MNAAKRYLIDLPAAEWIRFEDIPGHLFNEVFRLIDEQFAYIYYINDEWTCFKKSFREMDFNDIKNLPKKLNNETRTHNNPLSLPGSDNRRPDR
jgi:hypothetical protein